MLRIQQYQKVNSIEEAYELLQKNRNNQIIGGMLWLKMEDRTIPCGIDLSNLGLDTILEEDDKFIIGASVTLRQLENHPGLNAHFNNIFKESIKDIVGVQFRNLATVGGSLYSRFGFSDVLCAMLPLHCKVQLYHEGIMDIVDFANSGFQRDILTNVIVYKDKAKHAFECYRKSATDISTLNLCLTVTDDEYIFSVGARPKIAKLYHIEKQDDQIVAEKLQSLVECDSNMRASAQYRQLLVKALALKALKKVG